MQAFSHLNTLHAASQYRESLVSSSIGLYFLNKQPLQNFNETLAVSKRFMAQVSKRSIMISPQFIFRDQAANIKVTYVTSSEPQNANFGERGID